NIVVIRLIRMVRVSAAVSGARGAIGGASSTASTSVESSARSASMSSAKVWGSAGKRLCRSNLFMGEISFQGLSKATEIRQLRLYLEGKPAARQHPARMGGSHTAIIADT